MPSAPSTLHVARRSFGRTSDAHLSSKLTPLTSPRRVGDRAFPIAKNYVHRVALVDDEAIVKAQKVLWQILWIVAEPGGAAAFSAVVSGAYKPKIGDRVGIIISGGNTTAVDFDR
jgi:threonine dehydratase